MSWCGRVQAFGVWKSLLQTDVASSTSALSVARAVELGAMDTNNLTYPPASDYLLEKDAEEAFFKLEVTSDRDFFIL